MWGSDSSVLLQAAAKSAGFQGAVDTEGSVVERAGMQQKDCSHMELSGPHFNQWLAGTKHRPGCCLVQTDATWCSLDVGPQLPSYLTIGHPSLGLVGVGGVQQHPEGFTEEWRPFSDHLKNCYSHVKTRAGFEL